MKEIVQVVSLNTEISVRNQMHEIYNNIPVFIRKRILYATINIRTILHSYK